MKNRRRKAPLLVFSLAFDGGQGAPSVQPVAAVSTSHDAPCCIFTRPLCEGAAYAVQLISAHAACQSAPAPNGCGASRLQGPRPDSLSPRGCEVALGLGVDLALANHLLIVPRHFGILGELDQGTSPGPHRAPREEA